MATQVLQPEREISRGMVAIYKDYFGRGPTLARTTITETHVVVILEDAMTVVERRLAAEGNDRTVRSVRRKFQQAMSDAMMGLVTRVTGRRVRCLLSDHEIEADVAVEVLILEDRSADALG
jgi:uncharacterized protein YbcI